MTVRGFPQIFRIISLLLPLFATAGPVGARDAVLTPGKAFVTRFSGTMTLSGANGEFFATLNPDGVVGSLFDLRFPGHKPRGQHWRNEPQSLPVYARQTGQVFGIAFDDAKPVNIYLAATSAFGLYRTRDNTGWMKGMWGKGGGPGTIYKLTAKNGYKPEIFARIRLNGRANRGAALGNIAVDTAHAQLLVSDMQTGMIHRLDIKTGRDLGHFDHGGVARGYFYDAAQGHDASLPPVFYKPDTSPECTDTRQPRSRTPDCWRYTAPERRVWGIGVRRSDGISRLFYAIWDRASRSQVWSVALNDNGGFDTRSVRREFIVPAIAGTFSNGTPAISDIAFSGDGRMLLAERGAPRRTIIVSGKPVTALSQARVLQYRVLDYGAWELEGAYAIGNRNSAGPGEAPRFNNAAGGVSWGFARTGTGAINLSAPAGYVWASGDSLCAPSAPCINARGDAVDDTDFVTGIEGRAAALWAGNIARSYKIDTDINIDATGRVIAAQAARNDDSRGGGDVEIYKGSVLPAPASIPAPPVVSSLQHPASLPVRKDSRPAKLLHRAPVLPRVKPSKAPKLSPDRKRRKISTRRIRKQARHHKARRRAVITIFAGGNKAKRFVVPVR